MLLLCGIVQFTAQSHYEQRPNNGFVPNSESSLFLHATDEDEQCSLVQKKVTKVLQTSLYEGALVVGNLEWEWEMKEVSITIIIMFLNLERALAYNCPSVL